MSIASLAQVYDEMRRIAIAGSVVAPGDFRLKKLIPPLEQSGAKAPVFARAAEAVKAVVESTEATSAQALLDLAVLVNAVLYTQGETGVAGDLQPIESSELGIPAAQASARTIKPLLEALTNTGSGRLELIQDAFARGDFRDLRLVKPALAAIDDGYAEIAEFIADKVLPLYGKAILAELRASFDCTGRGGHPRRLAVMHRIDPAGTRDYVKKSLEKGSKEVKVAAIECLGADQEDVDFLLEQAGARAQDVRQAAYKALAAVEAPAAQDALVKALQGKDLEVAVRGLQTTQSQAVVSHIIACVHAELAAAAAAKDRKAVSAKVNRARLLLGCLMGRKQTEPMQLILDLFARREELAKIKGDTDSGSDINLTIEQLMGNGPPALQRTLAEAHGALEAGSLAGAFAAARAALPADRVFEMFAPYLTARTDDKKKKKELAKKNTIIETLLGGHNVYFWLNRDTDQQALDPRWLDVAVDLEDLRLVHQLARPGHDQTLTFLKPAFEKTLQTSRSLNDCFVVVSSMIKAEHPHATHAFLAALRKHKDKSQSFAYWFLRLIPDLPRSAIADLEAFLPEVPESAADIMLVYLQQLRDKKS